MKQTRTMKAIDYTRLNTKMKYCVMFGLERPKPVYTCGHEVKPRGFLADFSITFSKEEVRSEICGGLTEVGAIRKAMSNVLYKYSNNTTRYKAILEVINAFNEGYELVK